MSRLKDITGQVFGRYKVIGRAPTRGRNSYWTCECECGAVKEVRGSHLKRGGTVSCGCYIEERRTHKGRDLLGERFGRLLVVEKGYRDKLERFRWLCKCDCGSTTLCYSSNLMSGRRTSCGCLGSEKTVNRNKELAKPDGYKHTNSQGYVTMKSKNHPNADKKGWVLEHIFVMSNHLGRKIDTASGENIHHKNGIRHDNRIENLELWTSSQPKGQRVEDVIEFCEYYLRKYAPHKLQEREEE